MTNKKNVIVELDKDMTDSLDAIWDSPHAGIYENIRCTQDIVDAVMKEENNLEFEVGYLKGMERAVELIRECGGRFIPEFDSKAEVELHNCKSHAYCEKCGLKV
jgi:fructose/tagatose bisphosphate aldolase